MRRGRTATGFGGARGAFHTTFAAAELSYLKAEGDFSLAALIPARPTAKASRPA